MVPAHPLGRDHERVSPTGKEPRPKVDSERSSSTGATDSDLVEYLMVVVPENGSLTSLTPALTGLVASSAIRVLDLVCVARSATDGKLSILESEDVAGLAELHVVAGDDGGLLSERDIEMASVALPMGFVDIKVCAVDEVWSGLKLVVRKELR